MQALENAGRRSWVETYALCPKARSELNWGQAIMERISEHGIEQQRSVKASLLYVSIPIAIRCGGGLLYILLSFKRVGGPVP
jgi:hypothetical protein